MKKAIALVLAIISLLSASCALAQPDDPFKDNGGQPYIGTYSDHNIYAGEHSFNYVHLSTGQDLQAAQKAKKNTRIKEKETSMSAAAVNALLNQGNSFYFYEKWQFRENFAYDVIDIYAVLTTPAGDYYRTPSLTWANSNQNSRGSYYQYSLYLDVTDLLTRAKQDNGGTLPKGWYSFTIYFNNGVYRSPRDLQLT